MNVLRIIVFFCVLALVSVAAEAQTNVRVRGTITAFDGQVLSVKSREGKDLALQMTEQTTVAAAKEARQNNLAIFLIDMVCLALCRTQSHRPSQRSLPS